MRLRELADHLDVGFPTPAEGPTGRERPLENRAVRQSGIAFTSPLLPDCVGSAVRPGHLVPGCDRKSGGAITAAGELTVAANP